MTNLRQAIPEGYTEYSGEYEKVYYDIMLGGGILIEHCYPNAGTFHTESGIVIDGKYVKAFKKSKRQFPEATV